MLEKVLLDTSIWIDHFRKPVERLMDLIRQDRAIVHPFVVGELACGYLHPRDEIIHFLRRLPEAVQATDDEALTLLENRRLYGKGLGWVDVHLLASARISHCAIWSLDKPLAQAAKTFGLDDF